jgi:hypothetical protein
MSPPALHNSPAICFAPPKAKENDMSLLTWTTMGMLLAGGGLFARRPEPGRGPRRRPQRVLHPQRLAGVRSNAVWMLAGDPHCRHGHSQHGRHYLTADAPDLATLCQGGCHCHYHAVADRRGRGNLRFSLLGDRRDQPRRDHGNAWIDPLRQL